MRIIPRLLTLPKGNSWIPPRKRKCALCNRFGAHAHGDYPRYPPVGTCIRSVDMILVPRFLCLRCRKTFSLLPFFLVRRIAMPLPMLLFIARTNRTWDWLLDELGISRNTLWAWIRLGRALLEKIPEILGLPHVTWAILSLHISRWQYPNNLRKPVPTIP